MSDSALPRVLQIAQKPQRRGAEVFAFQLSAALRARGAEVRTAYLYDHGEAAPLPLVDGDVVLDAVERHRFERAPGIHPGVLRRLLAVIDDFDPDIVQVNGSRTVKYGAAAHALRRRFRLVYRNIGDPTVWITGWQRRLFYERLVLPRLDGVIGVSEATLDGVRSVLTKQVPVVRIPRAVDLDAFVPCRPRAEVRAELGTPRDVPVIVFVGSLTPEKRPDRLARVFAAVRAHQPDARLWVAGDGPLGPELAADLQRLGAADSASLLGMRPDVADLVHAADLLLLTSDTEGTPGAVLEAGAASVPVVATAVGGVPECVVDGRTGLLVEADDEEAMTHAVASLLVDPQRRQRMGIEARHHVSRHFALPAVVDDYLAFYARIREGDGRPTTARNAR